MTVHEPDQRGFSHIIYFVLAIRQYFGRLVKDWHITVWVFLARRSLACLPACLPACLSTRRDWWRQHGNLVAIAPYVIQGCSLLAMVLSLLTATVRRLHDSGRSGWRMCLMFVPVFGNVLLLLWLLSGSETRRNSFGPVPFNNQPLNPQTPRYNVPEEEEPEVELSTEEHEQEGEPESESEQQAQASVPGEARPTTSEGQIQSMEKNGLSSPAVGTWLEDSGGGSVPNLIVTPGADAMEEAVD